jgi:hypothetical protein
MKVIRPVPVTDANFVSSSVPETDHPAWAIGTTYGAGALVIKTATHRIYESLVAGNVGHDPADPAGTFWIDIGPTNRWAMFDEAIGSLTTATTSMTVTLEPGSVDAVAVLEAVAATVRVEVSIGGSPAYDETQAVDRAVIGFLDLPSDPDAVVTITIAGTGTISAGVVLVGNVLELGETEASPSIGITDYSRRDTDQFGVTTIIEGPWAKTMTLRTKVHTDDVSLIQTEVAKLRAIPALWLGEEGYDSLSVYGAFKSFSAELALEDISFVSFTIEGLGA